MSQQYPQQPQWQQQPQTQWQQQYPPQQPSFMYYPLQQFQQFQQQPPQKKKSRRGLWIGLGIVALVLLTTCIGVTAIVSNAAKTASTLSVDASQHHRLGESAIADGGTWQVTPISATFDRTGNTISQPKAGHIFLVIHAAVKNVSTKSALLASTANFTLRDTNGNTYTENVWMSDKYTALTGTVNTHEQIQGDLVYEVPTAAKDFNLYFRENVYNGTPVEWDIHTA